MRQALLYTLSDVQSTLVPFYLDSKLLGARYLSALYLTNTLHSEALGLGLDVFTMVQRCSGQQHVSSCWEQRQPSYSTGVLCLHGWDSARLSCVSDKDGAVPCQHHHPTRDLVELHPLDVPAWISPSSGTFVPWLVSQDRMALSFQGAVTLQKNAALQTLLCDLHPKQIRTSSSLCQTHPNHPRSPACLRLLVPPFACSRETFMHGSSTRDFTRSYYLYNQFKFDYDAFFIACLSILCFIVCCSDWF